MFAPKVTFAVEGGVGDVEFTVHVEVRTAEAEALPGSLMTPLVVDVQNLQVLFVSAINDVLMKIQHMNEEASFESLRVGRNAQVQVELPSSSGPVRVIKMSDYVKSRADAEEGKGD